MKPSQTRLAPLTSFVLVGALCALAPHSSLAANAHVPAAQADFKPIKRAAQPPATTTSKVTTPVDELEQAKRSIAKEHDDAEHAEEVQVPIVTQPKIVSGPAPGTVGHESPTASSGKKAPANVSSATAHDTGGSIDAEQSLRWLANGNTRYMKRQFRGDGRTQSDRDRLVKGQHPHAIVLACSDSRVSPEIVFDQVQGEIFTIRVAGEALDSSVIASIEYAVEHLGPKLIVVMGHTKCGAIDAAINIKEGDSAGSESLDKLLADIRPRLRSIKTEKPSHNLEVESTVNADGIARDLVERSELIRKKVEAGELKIKPALYRMDSGKVTFY